MKVFLSFVLFIASTIVGFAQYSVTGRVLDEHNQPLGFVNVFIKETLEGVTTSESGEFSFTVSTKEKVSLNALLLGYEPYTHTCTVAELSNITIKLKPVALSMDEAVVRGRYFTPKENSSFSNITPIDVATTAGAAGNLFGALQVLPGVQMEGESGKLLIRGGDSRETQVYIDDMHVLSPYTSTGPNVPARSRYSPFLFEGINLSTGAYAQEYADGLSGVLPLSTKDESSISKLGINPSTVGLAGGGTKAFDQGSFSSSMDYQHLGPYQRLIPDRIDWAEPYKQFTSSNQFRLTPNNRTVFKTYLGYDHTAFAQQVEHLPASSTSTSHEMNFRENNLYANSTFRTETPKAYQWFAGAAFGNRSQQVLGAVHSLDHYTETDQELHLKLKLTKRINRRIQFSTGAESFFRHYVTRYTDTLEDKSKGVSPSFHAAFIAADVHLARSLNLNVSGRLEHHDLNKQWSLSPRLGLGYMWGQIHFTAAAGRYTQQADNNYLLRNNNLRIEDCLHYVVGAKLEKKNRIYRVEIYTKQYGQLALDEHTGLNSHGSGYVKGVDIFFNDRGLIPNLEYQFSYSYNLSERKYREYLHMTMPPFITQHHASVMMKYSLSPLRSIVGITYQFASGRPIYNSTSNLADGFTRPYHNVDMSLTVLLTPRMLIHASASNILGAKHVFGKKDGVLVLPASDHFFYLGVFITLAGKTAYDVSNF